MCSSGGDHGWNLKSQKLSSLRLGFLFGVFEDITFYYIMIDERAKPQFRNAILTLLQFELVLMTHFGAL